MRIGELAQRTGLSIDAIRFYEKQRLLELAPRTEGGFRVFHAGDLQRIQFIRRAQGLGLSLPEIRELLVLQGAGDEACVHVRDLLAAKVAAVRIKLQELRALERQLTRSLHMCERRLRDSGDSHRRGCPVIEEIARRGFHDN